MRTPSPAVTLTLDSGVPTCHFNYFIAGIKSINSTRSSTLIYITEEQGSLMRIPISLNTAANETEAVISGAFLMAVWWSHGCKSIYISVFVSAGEERGLEQGKTTTRAR